MASRAAARRVGGRGRSAWRAGVGPLAAGLCAWLLGSPMARAAPKEPAVQAESLPAERGVLAEARGVVDGKPDEVARVAADPGAFLVLFPAERAEAVGETDGDKLVAVRMREPVIGAVEWVERVAVRSEGEGYVIERSLVTSTFYKWMTATWRIAPTDEGRRSLVTYRIAFELKRVPSWMARRGAVSGVRGTVERLRGLVRRGAGGAP